MDVGTVLSVAQTLFAALQCSELKEILSVFGYKSELEDLQRTVSTINAVFRDAETKQELTHEAQHWIEELKDAVFEADDLFDEFVTLAEQKQLVEAGGKLSKKVSHFFSRSYNPLSVAYRMSRGVKDIKKKLDAIATNSLKFGFKIDSEPIRKRRPETCSYVNEVDIIGREVDLENIVDTLFSYNDQRDVSFLTIVGIGGLGKTALAQLVYNDPRVTTGFPLKLWTCVADQDQKELDVKEILSKILASAVAGYHDQGFTMDQVQHEVRQQLAGKKFLLVLDDVWTEQRDQWCELVKYLTGGERGSWIVVTTRSQKTATIVGGLMYELQGLSHDNSWRLFEKTAFGSDQSNPSDELVNIGREIVDGCVRVPLAIRVAGSLLFGQDKIKWQSFKKIGLANIRQSESGIIPILKLSFDHLETPLKSCFSYCAMFPKDLEIDKQMLISLWVAHGYVVPLDKGQSIEEAAEEYFLILLRRCFFQDIEKDEFGEITSCKMHDLMHDIALSVSGKEIANLIPNTIRANLNNKVRHLSIASRRGYAEHSWGKTHIRSHLFVDNCLFKVGPPSLEAFVVNCRGLRALDLSGLGITSLPTSIGELLHLRYLDLSKNINLKVFPKSIIKLYNLQTLILRRCHHLKELPKELTRLVKLRVLEIEGCSKLTYMPRGMGELICLQRLSNFIVSGEEGSSSTWKQWFDRMEDLKPLNNIRGCLNILIRWPKIAFKDDAKREGLYLRSKEHLNVVCFNFKNEEAGVSVDNEVARRLMEDMHPHPNLKELQLRNYSGDRIPNWATLLPNLVKLHLHDCWKLEYLPNLGSLCHLKWLSLFSLANLEYIEGVGSSATELPFFPSLEKLMFFDVPELKGWRRGFEDNKTVSKPCSQLLLPCLSGLAIEFCPKLTCIPLCPRLEVINLSGFNKELRITDSTKFGEIACSSLSASTTCCHEISNPSTSSSSGSPNLENSGSSSTSIPVPKLKTVSIDNTEWLNALPVKALQCVETLTISKAFDLVDLPNCMQFLTALQTLVIQECKGLEAMPNWMPKLTSLRKFRVWQCSEILERRCQKDPPGEDWPYIQHIPDIRFGNPFLS